MVPTLPMQVPAPICSSPDWISECRNWLSVTPLRSEWAFWHREHSVVQSADSTILDQILQVEKYDFNAFHCRDCGRFLCKIWIGGRLNEDDLMKVHLVHHAAPHCGELWIFCPSLGVLTALPCKMCTHLYGKVLGKNHPHRHHNSCRTHVICQQPRNHSPQSAD